MSVTDGRYIAPGEHLVWQHGEEHGGAGSSAKEGQHTVRERRVGRGEEQGRIWCVNQKMLIFGSRPFPKSNHIPITQELEHPAFSK